MSEKTWPDYPESDHLMAVEISMDTLCELMTTDKHLSGWPEGVYIVAVQPGNTRDTVSVWLNHESFPAVPFGHEIPPLTARDSES